MNPSILAAIAGIVLTRLSMLGLPPLFSWLAKQEWHLLLFPMLLIALLLTVYFFRKKATTQAKSVRTF